jgi:XTP/dITP diphosphohydrolase
MTFIGKMEGTIAHKPMGENGFGYDPIMYIPEYEKTVAELDSETKNRISHRGKAFEQLSHKLRNWSLP